MRENQLRAIWNRGGCVLNGWLAIPNGFAAEVAAHSGWDSLCIDIQHGIVDYQAAVGMMQAISTTNVTPLVRVPWNDPGIIMKCLDAGAYGVVCPMINNRNDAQRFVQACRYPPAGYRSSGPTRAVYYGGNDYLTKSNETIVTFAMIETADGLTNLDEILTTPGLDAVYIGPNDLALALGVSGGLDPTHAKTIEAISHILAACKRHKIRAGIHTGSIANARAMMAKGFDFVTVLSEARIMAQAMQSMIKEIKSSAAASS